MIVFIKGITGWPTYRNDCIIIYMNLTKKSMEKTIWYIAIILSSILLLATIIFLRSYIISQNGGIGSAMSSIGTSIIMLYITAINIVPILALGIWSRYLYHIQDFFRFWISVSISGLLLLLIIIAWVY